MKGIKKEKAERIHIGIRSAFIAVFIPAGSSKKNGLPEVMY